MKFNPCSIASMAVAAFLVGVIGLSTPGSAGDTEAAAAPQKSVLVTGASSGIGLKITETLKMRMDARGVDLDNTRYKEEMESTIVRLNEPDQDKAPDEVAEAVYHALFDPNPKMRYMVVPNERQAEITIRKAIQEMVELNQHQTYTFDRDTLIEMLDEALEAGTATPE